MVASDKSLHNATAHATRIACPRALALKAEKCACSALSSKSARSSSPPSSSSALQPHASQSTRALASNLGADAPARHHRSTPACSQPRLRWEDTCVLVSRQLATRQSPHLAPPQCLAPIPERVRHRTTCARGSGAMRHASGTQRPVMRREGSSAGGASHPAMVALPRPAPDVDTAAASSAGAAERMHESTAPANEQHLLRSQDLLARTSRMRLRAEAGSGMHEPPQGSAA
jgi:hypothetical protein